MQTTTTKLSLRSATRSGSMYLERETTQSTGDLGYRGIHGIDEEIVHSRLGDILAEGECSQAVLDENAPAAV